MGSTFKNIVISITGNASGLNSTLKQASSGVSDFGTEVEDANKSTGRLRGGLLALGAAALATVAGAARQGFGRLTALENADKRLSDMGLTVEQTDSLMESLNDTLTGTPYALQDGATAMAGFVAAGVGLEDVPRYMDMVTDAAAFGQAPLGEIANVFQRIARNGRVTAREMEMLQSRGLPALSMLSDAAGMTAVEFQDFLSSGALSADEFFRLWEEGAEGFGENGIKIAGAAQGIGDTTEGALANMRTAFTRFGARILEPFFDLFRTGALQAQSALGSIGDVVGPASVRLAEFLREVSGELRPLLGYLWDMASAVAPAAGALAGLVGSTVLSGITTLAGALSTIVGLVFENEYAFGLLASVVGMRALPVVAALAAQLRVRLWQGMSTAVVGVANAFDAVAGGASRASVAAGLATAGLTVLLAAVAVLATKAASSWREAQQAARDLSDELGQNARSTVRGLEQSLEGLRKEHADLTGQFQDRSFTDHAKNILNWNDQVRLGMGATRAEIEELEEKLRSAESTARVAIHAIQQELGVELDLDAIYELADALGIDLTTAARDQAVPALVDGAAAAREGDPDYQNLTDTVEGLATAYQEAANAVRNYAEELRAQSDPLFRAQKALQDYADARENLRQLHRDGGASERELAEAQRAVASAYVDQTEALAGLRDEAGNPIITEFELRAMMEGEPEEVIDRMVSDLRLAASRERDLRVRLGVDVDATEFGDFQSTLDAYDGREVSASANLVTRSALDAFGWLSTASEDYESSDPTATAHLDPGPAQGSYDWLERAGIAYENSDPEADAHLNDGPFRRTYSGIQGQLSLYERWNPWTSINADATAARSELDGFIQRLRDAGFSKGDAAWSARLTAQAGSVPQGDGPGAGGPALARVRAAMEGLPGLRVTSTYRTPARNAAVGGSPNSYHLDRGNPAVDVAGPRASLDRLYQRLQRIGGRELIWRAPGHYNHLHYAADGAVFEDHTAQIARAGDWRVWAEPETGGEAYIPLAPSKRERSEVILADVARRFGYQLATYAHGGVTGGQRAATADGRPTVEVTQNFYGEDTKKMGYEARHQARMLAVEVGA